MEAAREKALAEQMDDEIEAPTIGEGQNATPVGKMSVHAALRTLLDHVTEEFGFAPGTCMMPSTIPLPSRDDTKSQWTLSLIPVFSTDQGFTKLSPCDP